MRLLIIDENGIREFSPKDQNGQNQQDSKSVLELLKESLTNGSENTQKDGLNLYTISELVDLFTTTRPTIYSWIDNGDLIPIKIGGRVYFNQKDIEQMLERKISESGKISESK